MSIYLAEDAEIFLNGRKLEGFIVEDDPMFDDELTLEEENQLVINAIMLEELL